MTTEKIHPESPEEFEFIETPPASCITPADPCGVRTTSVSFLSSFVAGEHSVWMPIGVAQAGLDSGF